jgi:hypothetical protein
MDLGFHDHVHLLFNVGDKLYLVKKMLFHALHLLKILNSNLQMPRHPPNGIASGLQMLCAPEKPEFGH